MINSPTAYLQIIVNQRFANLPFTIYHLSFTIYHLSFTIHKDKMKTQIEIIYEDEDVVVVNKPPLVLTIPDRYAPEKFNLVHWLNERYGNIFVVHRLDKETSGILIFARNEAAHKALSQQFEERTVEKIYFTLVEGKVHEEEGIIDKPIAPHPVHPEKMIIAAHGKPSVTHYKAVEYFKNYTFVEANIKTGRTHQIRVHFQSLGYPLAVDALYGRKEAFMLSDVKLGKYKLGKGQTEHPLMTRSSLHAGRLTFKHPSTGEIMSFEAPLPKDFAAVMQQLRKWGKQSLGMLLPSSSGVPVPVDPDAW